MFQLADYSSQLNFYFVNIRDRCYGFFAEKYGEKHWRSLLKLLLVFAKKNPDVNICFWEKRYFFSPKIGENCDHV
jgi:hypothetical protein